MIRFRSKKTFAIEYRIKPEKANGMKFLKDAHEWVVFKRYKTAGRRDQALKDMLRKQGCLFEYREKK